MAKKPIRGRRSPPSGSGSGSSSHSRSFSGSSSRSSSRSRSRSSASSSSRSGSSRSPSPRSSKRSPGARRGRSPPPSKRASPPPRKASPAHESLVLHIDKLTRNVNEGHLKEIFGNYGEVVNVELAMDHSVNLPKGFGYVEFKMRADAEKALLHMDGGQIDGNVVQAKFTLSQRQKSPPPKAVVTAPKRDTVKADGINADKDGPKRLREASPRRRPPSPPRRSPVARRGGSPRRRLDSPPPRRRPGSPYRRVDTSPRRRPTSPSRGRSGSPPPRRRSPARVSPRRMRGSPPARRRGSPPARRRSPPRRARSPPRRSPIIRRRSRSPIRRPARSHSRSISPRRGRGPATRRGRSSSSSSSGSPGPRKAGGYHLVVQEGLQGEEAVATAAEAVHRLLAFTRKQKQITTSYLIDLRKLGSLQPQSRPPKLLPCNCFWRLPRSKSTSRELLRLSLAQGKEAEDSFIPNVSEDTDDMFDDLFDRYGKVVYSRKDKKPPSEELDDDAESLSFAVELAKVANEVKAGDIKVLFVKPLVYWTRFFIIVTAFSRPQINAIGTKMRDLAEKKYGKVPTGDAKPNSWTLLDFGDVVIHIFLPPQRDFYNLEEFYGNATPVELPFENQPPMRG
ncbi:hypothetical protein ACLB2K_025608 [Fragaria x ananassa]